MISKKSLLLVITVLISAIFFTTGKTEVDSLNINYIVTETAGPDSFDPLNADKTQNLAVMRMLYFTPFEVDKNNLLKSSVFENYEYDSTLNVLKLEAKSNLFFDDGSPIEVQDILLSILRMSYFKPDFPMIKEIIGVKKWSEAQRGLSSLPEGIEVSGSKITIKFRKMMLNPMFRLCLELFSIIPKRCIDLSSGKFVCDIAPASGYFKISNRSNEKIIFEKRDLVTPGAENITANYITFSFKKLTEICNTKLSENEIVAASELDYINSKCDFVNAHLHWMAASRFGVLRFNTNIHFFSSPKYRNFFAEQVRKQIDSMNIGLRSERSLLSPLLPGYLERDQFSAVNEDLKEYFKGQKITLVSDQAPVLSFTYKAILETAKSLEMDVEIVQAAKNEEIVKAFLANKISVIAGASGFWAQDPVGDISMWFTKNLHKTMTFAWADNKLYSLLEEIENETTESDLSLRIQDLNKHIYNSSIVAPLVHFRRLYITNSNIKSLNLPQAITSPAPWQISL